MEVSQTNANLELEDRIGQEEKHQRFDPSLRAENLPRTVLIDLWQRTVIAYENLFRTWYIAVGDRFGATVAEGLASEAWPKYHKDIPMRDLFFDDLKLASRGCN